MPRFTLALCAVLVAAWVALPAASAAQEAGGEEPAAGAKDEEGEEKAVDPKTIKNPFPHTRKSIGRGRAIFVRYCAECHDRDAKALSQIIADATNLTEPGLYRSGTTPGEMFVAIRDGAGLEMPPFSFDIRREEDMWHMVNFLRSLWPEDKRPKLLEESEDSESEPR